MWPPDARRQALWVQLTRAIRRSVAVDEDNVPTATKRQDCADAVAATFAMLRAGLTARDIMTKKAFENAVTVQVRSRESQRLATISVSRA